MVVGANCTKEVDLKYEVDTIEGGKAKPAPMDSSFPKNGTSTSKALAVDVCGEIGLPTTGNLDTIASSIEAISKHWQLPLEEATSMLIGACLDHEGLRQGPASYL